MKKADLCGFYRTNYIETHADVLSRVLFIYAKLNPGVMYVQGMNEVLATLYYCFYDPTLPYELINQFFESDLFFCFNKIMSEIMDGFIRTMDSETTGINGRVKEFEFLFSQIDPELHAHLEEQGLNPQFYSLRWLMLMLSQEFALENVIRLWDTLLADHDRFLFVNFVCVAMVMLKRDTLLKSEFSECIEYLQLQQQENKEELIRTILN